MVVSSAQYLVVAGLLLGLCPIGLALRATPSAPSKEASQYFIDVASTPPLRGGECCLRTDFQTETLPAIETPTRRASRVGLSRGRGEKTRHRFDAVCYSVDTKRHAPFASLAGNLQLFLGLQISLHSC